MATPIIKPYAPSATDSSASSTVAYATTRSTTNTKPGHTACQLPLDTYGPGMSSQRKRIADFVAADKYPVDPVGSGLAFHGHEVKVSRGDWLAELQDPSKADALKRYMHHWWLVVPDAAIVKPSELPEDWGLLVTSGEKLRAKVSAPRLTPESMPVDLAMSLMSAAARTAYRDPLRRDAPVAYRDRDPTWTSYCGFCYEPSPCPVHQPRKHALAQPA